MIGPIAVVFDSAQGHTAKLAGALSEAMEHAGAQTRLFPLAERSCAVDDLDDCAAIVFGAPTFMGGVSARFKAFMDASSEVWMDQPWRDRVAGGFTVGSNHSGDKLATLQHMAIFAAQHGMIWVGQSHIGPLPDATKPRGLNGDGSWLGLMATASRDKEQLVPEADLETARLYGHRLAVSVMRWGAGVSP